VNHVDLKELEGPWAYTLDGAGVANVEGTSGGQGDCHISGIKHHPAIARTAF